MDNQSQELIFIHSSEGEIPYKWAAGRYGSHFLTEIRDNGKFWGVRCPSCQKVYIPPRRVCGPCFAEMTEWVELGEEGILTGFSIVDYGFLDPDTGKARPVPYTTIYVKLDGADTGFCHSLDETDLSKIKVGMRVRAVFKPKEKREGMPTDIEYFTKISD
ncbi:Zn-ribbon domain-containing OB-fold protein [Thermodesulfobacteriota bacterium]